MAIELPEIEMVFVEGGTFMMGSDAYYNEQPVHQVTLDSFYIGKFPVTQRLWLAVMKSSTGRYKGDNFPVVRVGWLHVQDFLRKLNDLTGKNYHLPTEAEWEYAARGGNKSKDYKYAGSNDIDLVGWYDGNSGKKSHEVGTRFPNELGIYDMSGNVGEWCQDWYGSYSSALQSNPKGPTSGLYRVYRGGGCYDYAGRCRVSDRNYSAPDYRNGSLGFRLAL